ncbi:DUF4783 domain-containing protein [Agriterribacter sp.]|uniref:DUF4783 domain-containing protein n=1 Tax=Agriterribacter sp. TaxID=2821509 RepID=UPI002CCAAB7A|nr:DUF4783 domain-containing protein [Agriterribacter sp.]HRO45617.1 DUF4783 domain-containing protein [Agriterribacter sp.]HRQ17438.1 DUF4783 domain-containing protein [Agriterribacter sp.]
MKNYVIKILLSVLMVGGFAFNYSDSTYSSSIDDVVTAINSGNVNQLSSYFDKIVEITLHDKSNTYSRSQAEIILKDFFHSYGVKAFRIVHKGSNSGSEFCIGNLQTKYGAFRTTIFMKTRSRQQVLQEIRFEEN